MTAKVFKTQKVARYVQVHQTSDFKETAKTLGLEHLDYDGCSDLWVEKCEDVARFFASEEYQKVKQPDCHKFIAMPLKVFADRTISFGEALPGTEGKDWVTNGTLQSVE